MRTLRILLAFAALSLLAAPLTSAKKAPEPAAAAPDDAKPDATAAKADAEPEEVTDETCLECHLDPDTTKTVGGKEIPLVIDKKAFDASVHADEGCTSCHVGFDPDEVPHRPKIEPVNCTSCHEDEEITHQIHGGGAPKAGGDRPSCKQCHGYHSVIPAEKMSQDPSACLKCHDGLDGDAFSASAHGMIDGGERHASCSDCHGAHVILSSDNPESRINPGKLPKTCGECHPDEAKDYDGGGHAFGYRHGVPDSPTCVTCHEPHDTPVPDPARATLDRAAAQKVCVDCHKTPKTVDPKTGRPAGSFIDTYLASVHGQARADGTPRATCVDCHGAHATGNRFLPGSPLSRQHTAETCGKCHAKELAEYQKSAHAHAIAAGNDDGATCTDCHGEHDIRSAKDAASRVSPQRLSREACGKCHGSVALTEKYGDSFDRLTSFENSYHGLALVGHSDRAANCASCHGAHDILPASDPASRVNPDNLGTTCGACHEGATAAFVHIPVHTGNKPAHPVNALVKTIYLWMIVVVIGGMFLHNLMIYIFFVVKKYRHERSEERHQRFLKFEVWQHFFLLVSFSLAVITGFSLKFPHAFWVEGLKWLGMTEQIRRIIHRGAAVVMVVGAIAQVVYFIVHKRGRREIMSLMPRAKDATDAIHNILYYLGRRPTPPRFDRYDYTEKAEYLALIWGTAVMAATGFILWFPELMPSWAPDWTFQLAETIHFLEAWLATLAILVWHMFFVVAHPNESPMSTVMFDGKMTHEEWRERHPVEYERETGKSASDVD